MFFNLKWILPVLVLAAGGPSIAAAQTLPATRAATADDLAVARMMEAPTIGRWSGSAADVERGLAGCLSLETGWTDDWDDEEPYLLVMNTCSFALVVTANIGVEVQGKCQTAGSLVDQMLPAGGNKTLWLRHFLGKGCIIEISKLRIAANASRRPATPEDAAAKFQQLTAGKRVSLNNDLPGQWSMSRYVTGVTAVRPCFSRFETPEAFKKSGAATNPAKFMGVDWKDILWVRVVGKKVGFRASWMEKKETGFFELPTALAAAEFAGAMETLALRCR